MEKAGTGREMRAEGPVLLREQFLERFVRNFRRADTLSSWYSNTQVVGSTHRKRKGKQRVHDEWERLSNKFGVDHFFGFRR